VPHLMGLWKLHEVMHITCFILVFLINDRYLSLFSSITMIVLIRTTNSDRKWLI
jgi:hypothetical protein